MTHNDLKFGKEIKMIVVIDTSLLPLSLVKLALDVLSWLKACYVGGRLSYKRESKSTVKQVEAQKQFLSMQKFF